jgi:hypothetical protein
MITLLKASATYILRYDDPVIAWIADRVDVV